MEARVRALAHLHDLGEELLLTLAQGLKLAVAIVQNAHRAGEAQFQGAARHGERILGLPHRAAQHGVDIHLENRIARQHLELAVEHLQAFLGNLVRARTLSMEICKWSRPARFRCSMRCGVSR